MSDATVSAAEWIKRIADDERRRDAVRAREAEIAARKLRLVNANGQRLIDELRTTVVRDVAAFRAEFDGDRQRQIDLEITESGGGFIVSKPAPPAVALEVIANLDSATIKCRYRFTTANGLPPREERLELVFAGDGKETEALQIRHNGTGQMFTSSDALSEFLLIPVFTGRPR
jgi:hypothetical protein